MSLEKKPFRLLLASIQLLAPHAGGMTALSARDTELCLPLADTHVLIDCVLPGRVASLNLVLQ